MLHEQQELDACLDDDLGAIATGLERGRRGNEEQATEKQTRKMQELKFTYKSLDCGSRGLRRAPCAGRR